MRSISPQSTVEQIQREDRQFLWADACPERLDQLRNGTTIAELYPGKRPIPVPDGLVHGWIRAICIPGAALPAIVRFQSTKDFVRVADPSIVTPTPFTPLIAHGDETEVDRDYAGGGLQ